MYHKTEQEIMQNWEGDINVPIVSVCCTTYNHENYIAEAIDGFLVQETDFPFEILVRDDCSTDRTTEIVKEYADKYPSLIKPVFEKENTYSKGVKPMSQLYKIAIGKYIALCEGDDYWTDPLKLQMQVDFLEENKDVSIVHTDFNWLDMKNSKVKGSYYQINQMNFSEKYAKEIYLIDTYIRTMTVCFRKNDMNGYEKIQNDNWKLGDVPLFLYLSREKSIGYINQSTGVYRRGEDTASTPKNATKMLEFWRDVWRVKFYFYDFLNINNLEVKEKLFHQYNDELLGRSLSAKEYTLTLQAITYKMMHMRLHKNDIRQIIIFIYLNLKLDKIRLFFRVKRKKYYDNYLEYKLEKFNRYKKSSGLNSKKRNMHVVISLTSYHKRFHLLHLTLESLLNQSYKPDKIILWLSKEDVDKKPLSEKVKKLKDRGIDIQIVDENIRSYKKLIYTLKKYPNSYIVTCDDDILYDTSFLKGLVKTNELYRNCIIAYTCRMMKLIDSHTFEPYMYSNYVSYVGPSSDLLPIGANGIMYPPHSLNKEVENKENFLKLAPHADDLWFKAMALLNNTKTVLVNNKSKNIDPISSLQNEALYHINLLNNKNDEQLKNIFDFYSLYPKINKMN